MRAADTSPFVWSGGPIGCLLIHGFSGTPYELRYLGERLREAGHSVRCPRLPGHATLERELVRARHRDWLSTAAAELDALDETCESTVVIGLSMGALLAAQLAHERGDKIGGLVLLAPALTVANEKLYRFAPLMQLLVRVLPGRWQALPKLHSDVADPEAREINPRFPMPLRGLLDLIALQQQARTFFPAIRQPVLLLHGRLDSTCLLDNVRLVQESLAPAQVRTRIFDRSGHVLTVDAEKEAVAGEIVDFVREVSRAPAPCRATL